MTLETFFEKFNLLADAPDAVATMRELVLELAATGQLLACKSEWEKRSLKSLATKIGSGATPAGGRESYFSKGIPLIRSMNVHFRGFDRTGLVFLSGEQADELSNVIVQASDVLLNITGASIGRVTLAPPEMAGARVNQHVTIIRPTAELLPRFLSTFLASPSVQRMIDDVQVGATRQALTKGMIEQFEIPLPPLAEQKRIVAKVDELMALCDRLEAQQQERETQHAVLARAALARFAEAPTPANLDFLFHKSYTIPPADLRKSILTLAVQRKLVKSTVELDERTVGDHIDFLNGYAFKSQWFKPEGIRLCRNVNVSHGVVDWRECAFVDDNVAKEFQRFALSEGDIVLSLDRPIITTGLKVARIRKSDLPCLLLQRVAKPVPKHDQIDMSYFMLWLNSSEFVDSIDPGRSNGVPHISTKQVQLLPFVLPPLAEQRRIVAKVNQLMALVDALETQLAASRTAAENLLSALISELTTKRVPEKTVPAAPAPVLLPKPAAHKPPNRHFARALLSAEIIHRLHEEKTLGRTKHQKIFHVCEHIAQLSEIQGQYHREAAGPLDNRLIYANEAELKKQQWYEEFKRDSYGHAYRALPKAGAHRTYLERYWPEKLPLIERLIEMMRSWDTERCEIFSTAYAAWNDLLIQGREPTHEAILHEILNCWNDTKKRIPADRWLKAIEWMKKEGFEPKGFGKPTLRRP